MKQLYTHLFILLFFTFPSFALAATAVPITVTMSEPVNVTGCPANCPRLTLDVGGNTPRYAEYSAGSGTATLTFTYTTQAGDVDLDGITITSNTIDLNTSGTVKDLSGNNLSPLTFTIPNTAAVKVNHPSLSMDFVGSDYILNDTHYATLPLFLSAATGTFTRASVGTYFDSSGTMQTATAGTPRFDHDPVTHAAKGILIEEVRINKNLHSEQGDNAVYNKRNCTISANAVIAPSGATTADKIVEDTGSSFKELQILNTSVSAASYTASAYVKSAGRNYLYIYESQTQRSIVFDLSLVTPNGRYTGGGSLAPSYGISSVGNGWYRVWMTWAANAGNIPYIAFGLRDAAGNFNSGYTGNGSSGIYIWGMQVELGAFPTSYIPTTTSAVTRAADILTVPTGGWYNQSAGTIYGQGTSMVMSIDHRLATIRQSSSDYYGLRITSGNQAQMVAYDAGGIKSVTSSGTVANGGIKMVATQQLNNLAVTYSGVLPTSSSTWSPVTASYLAIGYDGVTTTSGFAFMNGYIGEIKYYPTRVANTQLQLLTQ